MRGILMLDDYELDKAMVFAKDPLGFVLAAFPWKEGPLSKFCGPDNWQRDVLESMTDSLTSGKIYQEPLRVAVSSGHGIGKSALVAWIILWGLATCEGARGVVTANTEAQLKNKTWAELAKWHGLCHYGKHFSCTMKALAHKDKEHEKTWRVDIVPWSERNTEAFAGLHNQGKRVLLLFDEASAIPERIWEVAEGALTDKDTEILWCCFGNPTRNTGRFKECFGRFRHRWATSKIDSRTAFMTNKELLETWIADYGEDSDFVRVRVRGEFPRTGSLQLISLDAVEKAVERELDIVEYQHAARIMAVDVARFGADQSVITLRQGLHCFPQKKFRELDLMTLASVIAREFEQEQPDALFVDGVGIGAGVIDRLRQLHIPVVDAQAGASALESKRFANRRAEMWVALREWLIAGGSLPDDSQLVDDLTGLEYGFTASDKLILEKKDDMKARGLASPDCADSLALTFYAPVQARFFDPDAMGFSGAKKHKVHTGRRS